MIRYVVTAVLAAVLSLSTAPAAPLSDERVAELSHDLFFGEVDEVRAALDGLVARGKRDVVPTLILALRYRFDTDIVGPALSKFIGTEAPDRPAAMRWQEAHPEIVPHPSFRTFKLEILRRLDHEFMRFLGGDRSKRENLKIRLEEIVWGGVSVDGIPALDHPTLVAASDADYLLGSDLVFGVEINGDARAYPLRIMGWHEMFNDTIGGLPVALAYCTLCGAGILYETRVAGRAKPFVFGSSGFLYRSNKLMFDRETDSLWNQFTGKPVSGPLRNSGIALKIRPVVITTWSQWKARHPKTRVLSRETGHKRDYGSGVVYKDYFASPDLMFPAIVRDESVARRKDYVFGIRDVGVARAWPLAAFRDKSVINDMVGDRSVVLIGDVRTRTVRAYDRGGISFDQSCRPDQLKGPAGDWIITEDALIGPDGSRLARVPGHISYWFAWDSYLGVNGSLYRPGPKN